VVDLTNGGEEEAPERIREGARIDASIDVPTEIEERLREEPDPDVEELQGA
jgi:hypothetical protein